MSWPGMLLIRGLKYNFLQSVADKFVGLINRNVIIAEEGASTFIEPFFCPLFLGMLTVRSSLPLRLFIIPSDAKSGEMPGIVAVNLNLGGCGVVDIMRI